MFDIYLIQILFIWSHYVRWERHSHPGVPAAGAGRRQINKDAWKFKDDQWLWCRERVLGNGAELMVGGRTSGEIGRSGHDMSALATNKNTGDVWVMVKMTPFLFVSWKDSLRAWCSCSLQFGRSVCWSVTPCHMWQQTAHGELQHRVYEIWWSGSKQGEQYVLQSQKTYFMRVFPSTSIHTL